MIQKNSSLEKKTNYLLPPFVFVIRVKVEDFKQIRSQQQN